MYFIFDIAFYIIIAVLSISVIVLSLILLKKSKKYNIIKEDYEELKNCLSEDIIISKFTLDCSSDYIFWTNKYGEIIYYNNKINKKFGYTNEIKNIYISDILKSHHFVPWKEYWEYIKENKTINFESGIINKDYKLTPVQVTSVYFILKGLEYNIIIAKENIQNIPNKPSNQIIKNQEINIQSDFFSNISHEIRTPMNAIVGFSDLILDKDLSDIQKAEIINQIKLNSENLLGFIDDIIDLSQIESQNIDINNQYHRINDLLLNIYFTYKETKSLFQNNNIGFSLRIDPKLSNFEILTDSIRLRQVFTNLIKNALKVTSKGYIEFGYKIKENNNLLFFVKNSGTALSINTLLTILEQNKIISDDDINFSMALRLLIAKNLISLMNGNIWIESDQVAGTTFFFNIPFEKIPSNIENKNLSTEIINWHNKTILIVDDLDYNFEIMQEQLKNTKAKIIWAKNGKEAIDICVNNKNIDLILMDIRMPVMDGYEATKEIKKYNFNIPIIAQTAFAISEEREKSIKAGCNDYITKPINYRRLIEVIDKYINN
jgi:signal transduction histidine kinase